LKLDAKSKLMPFIEGFYRQEAMRQIPRIVKVLEEIH